MNEPFSLEFCGSYIRVIHPPGFVATPESVSEMWGHFAGVCEACNCQRLLVEAPELDLRLDTMTAFEAGRQLVEVDPGLTIAFLLPDHTDDELSVFFKTVVQNRGMRVEIFRNEDDAKDWLAEDVD